MVGNFFKSGDPKLSCMEIYMDEKGNLLKETLVVSAPNGTHPGVQVRSVFEIQPPPYVYGGGKKEKTITVVPV